jgi:hypothetical protein
MHRVFWFVLKWMFKIREVSKIRLEHGDVLVITIGGPHTSNQLRMLQKHFDQIFYGNKVVVFGVGQGSCKFEAVSLAEASEGAAQEHRPRPFR